MSDSTQLVRLSPEMELDAQHIPHEVAAVVENTAPRPNRADTTDREYLLKMAIEVYRMRRYEPIIYIVAAVVCIVSILTPVIAIRHLPPARLATSITVTGTGVPSITTNGGGYTVIVTGGDGASVSTVTTGGSAETKQRNAEREAKRDRRAAERAERKAKREARRLEREADKLERQAEKLRRKAERIK